MSSSSLVRAVSIAAFLRVARGGEQMQVVVWKAGGLEAHRHALGR
jgi:hypothetical protein